MDYLGWLPLSAQDLVSWLRSQFSLSRLLEVEKSPFPLLKPPIISLGSHKIPGDRPSSLNISSHEASILNGAKRPKLSLVEEIETTYPCGLISQ